MKLTRTTQSLMRFRPALLVVLGSCGICLIATDLPAHDPPATRDRDTFVFLSGCYLPPPYTLRLHDQNTISLNGVEINEARFDLSSCNPTVEELRGPGIKHRSIGEEHRFHRRSQRTAVSEFCEALEVAIVGGAGTGDGVVVLSDGRRPLFLSSAGEGLELLKALSGAAGRQSWMTQAPNSLRIEHDRETWSQLVAGFVPSKSFLDRTSRFVNDVESIQAQNQHSSSATLFAEKVTYPVTVFSMMVVVLGFGHLLSNKPVIGLFVEKCEEREHAKKVVVRSLLIVVVLSMIDLVLTMTATQSGMMRELNPLGRTLIHDPLQLVLFKATSVSVAVGILYFVHHLPIAQAASWWICLVLTLVTARWVSFSSMFL